MNYYSLEPEVACQLGEKSVLDTSVHPPVVKKLHCIFDGWLGDDLLEIFPCYLTTERLKRGIQESDLSGYSFEDIFVSKSDTFTELYPNKELPNFYRINIIGERDKDDFVLSNENILLVSEKAYSVLKSYNLNNCDTE